MENSALQLQRQLLELQIELEESNYRYALELKKDQNILRRMRENIKDLKEGLNSLLEKDKELDGVVQV